jgi:hypothetical protein
MSRLGGMLVKLRIYPQETFFFFFFNRVLASDLLEPVLNPTQNRNFLNYSSVMVLVMIIVRCNSWHGRFVGLIPLYKLTYLSTYLISE